ncbi:MAG: hypothetical protein AAFW74_08395, partial [Pseudomonadota bacterium]
MLRKIDDPTAASKSIVHQPGQGSQTLAGTGCWRAVLLGTVAAGALFFGYGRSAHASCSYAGTTVTCTGDIADNDPPFIADGGITVSTPYTTLNVNSLNADLTPGAGTDGISFQTAGANAGDITIDADTDIATIGDGARGINARSISEENGDAASGAVIITHTGDITTAGEDASGVEALSAAYSETGNANSGIVT